MVDPRSFGEFPHSVIEKFERKVGNPNWITSGEIIPI